MTLRDRMRQLSGRFMPGEKTGSTKPDGRSVIAWLNRWLARPVAWGGSLLLTGVMVGACGALTTIYLFSRDLPESGSLADYKPAGVTRLYAAEGTLLAEYAKERRIFVPIDDIPVDVIRAFIAAEDQNFYEHRGIDPLGVLRAFVENLRRYNEGNQSLVGGSTITQQVVKNFLLSPEQSLSRKIREAILSLRITQNYSKKEILELYLNEIYLGLGAYGVAAAAQEYFDKELSDLTTEEAALLAGVPKAPTYYNPKKRPKQTRKRRDYVLRRMAEDGYISTAEYQRAKATELDVTDTHYNVKTMAPFFTESVRRDIEQRFGRDKLYTGGLFVKTTVEPQAQKLLEEAFRYALRQYDKRHGYRGPLATLRDPDNWRKELDELVRKTPLYGEQRVAVVLKLTAKKATIGLIGQNRDQLRSATLPLAEMRWARPVNDKGRMGRKPRRPADVLSVGDVILVSPASDKQDADTPEHWALDQIPAINGAMVAMRPQTGDVVAMVGGYSFVRSKFNRAIQARRQPGSAFKPFVYLAALERGFTPSAIIEDEPIEIEQGPGQPVWKPKNYGGDFLGPATLRTGIEKSRNVMTVRLAQMLGLEAIAHVGERFGIYEDMPANFSNVLGARETTLLKLVTAYSMLANGGLFIEPAMIRRIDDADGQTIYEHDSRSCENCNHTDGQITKRRPPALAEERKRVADPRIAYQVLSLLKGVATRGTAAKARVLPFEVGGKTGTTNDSRDAWFMGVTQELVVGTYIGFDNPESLGYRETGGRVALPAFIRFMKRYYEEHKPVDFVKPQGIVEVAVNRETGVPPLPWQQPGQTITETFITGGSVFIPGDNATIAGPYEDESGVGSDYVDYGAANEGFRTHRLTSPAWDAESRFQENDSGFAPSEGVGAIYGEPVSDNAVSAYGRRDTLPPHPRHRDRRRSRSGDAGSAASSGTGGLY